MAMNRRPREGEIDMTFRADYQPPFLRQALLVVAALALLAAGCNSNTNTNSTGASERSTAGGGQIDVNCVGNRIESPLEAFHYSFKSAAGGSVDKEAEITPQSMDVTIQDKSGAHKYHGVRSDEASWNNAVLSLSGSGFTAMSARIDSIKNKSAVARAGAEPMNGYQTTKYSIDTTRANSTELRAYEAFFGSGSSDKGTLWVTADGCPVKLILDEATKQADSRVDQLHYELDMIKR
jgi:hypothetical protein